MPDLPSVDQVTTGGIVAAIIGACGWLLARFRTAVVDGEALADQRMDALTADFSAYRDRVELERVATAAEMKALRSEVDDYRVELVETRKQLRICRADGHANRLEIDRLRAEISRLGGST